MCRSALSLQCELAHIAAHLILIPGERRAPLPRASIAALEVTRCLCPRAWARPPARVVFAIGYAAGGRCAAVRAPGLWHTTSRAASAQSACAPSTAGPSIAFCAGDGGCTSSRGSVAVTILSRMPSDTLAALCGRVLIRQQ